MQYNPLKRSATGSLLGAIGNYYSYGEHCWVLLQICINFNTKWRASNTFEAHSGGPQMYLRPATGKHGHLHT